MQQAKIFFLSITILLAGRCLRAEPGRLVESVSLRKAVREVRNFVLEQGQNRLDLERPFLIPGSDSLSIDGKPMRRGDDYRINTLRGTLIIAGTVSGGERVVVSFLRYPFTFQPVFATRFPEGVQPIAGSAPLPVPSKKVDRKRGATHNLRMSGSKTVGVSVGSNRGLGIDQSLKVTMVGKIAKELEVNATLSDDNLPVQPEGNTEELRHLDRVSVQIKSRHSDVWLGDFSTGFGWSRFSSFDRELRGVKASVDVGGQTFTAGGGISKGRFRTVSFIGRDGVQGPYELLEARRFNGLVILPGTELVHLDGRQLKRGRENDYTIDYSRGTMTFTERVPVTDDSEIEMDFQTGEDDYERSTLTAGWVSPSLGGSLRLRAFFFQESDDSGKPVVGGISDDEREILAGTGDDPQGALADGVEEVEEGNGSYVLVPADSVPEHFEFVESGGKYRLDFFEVGPGRGDYVIGGFSPRGEIKYSYIGPGDGDYIVGRRLPLPERRRLFVVGASAEKGHLFMDAEGNLSIHDKNLLSDRNDGDNAGGAMKLEGGFKDLPLSSATLSVIGEFSTLEDRFVSPGKSRDPYFYRNWNLEGVQFEGRERIGGATLRLKGERPWSLVGSYKLLSREAGLEAKKAELETSIGNSTSRGLSLKLFDSRDGGERERRFARGDGAFSFWHLLPQLSVESERFSIHNSAGADTGRYYYQGTISVAGRRIGGFSAGLSYNLRRTDLLSGDGGEWFHARDKDEIRADGGYTGDGRILDLHLVHRRSRDAVSGGTTQYDLARVRYRDSWEPAGLATDIGYRISSGEERTRERTVIFVGENQGDYDREGREVGQKRGDYMLLYLPGEEREAVRTVELSFRLSMGGGVRGLEAGGGDGGFLGRLRRNVSFDHFFSVVERSRTDDLFGLYTLSPPLMQRDGLTLYGVNKLRQEWNFFNAVERFDLRLTYIREDEEDNRSRGTLYERFTRRISLRAEAAPSSTLSLSLEGGADLRTREAAGIAEQNYRVSTLSASQITNYRMRPSMKLAMELGFENRSDEFSGAEQVSFAATPSFTSSLGTRLHVNSFVKFTYTDEKTVKGKPLFFLEEGLREDWSLAAQYRFTRNVSFGANYTGRREKDFLGEAKTIHDLKMESRAYF